jgi:metalloendopeptidase OMA1, mitochondrial
MTGRAGAVLLAAALLAACRTVPGSGRSQLNLVNESALAASAADGFREMPRSRDPVAQARVRAVAHRIIEAARTDPDFGDPALPPPSAWDIAVIADDTPNAFALPGGRIGFHSGMFRLASTEDEIAVIIGHEVAHVVCRHGNERVSQALLASLGAVALDQSLGDKDAGRRRDALAVYGAAATLGVILPYSRHHEAEADHLGLLYMARAGYRPAAAVTFWRRFAGEGKGKPPEFLSTHPSDTARVAALQALLPEAERRFRPHQDPQRASTPTGPIR